jgi:hypothetical protein
MSAKYAMPTFLLGLLCQLPAVGQSIEPRAMPAIVQRATPSQVLEMWRVSATNPRALLPYLDVAAMQQARKSMTAEEFGERKILQYMAVRRLGDVAGPDLAPRLDAYADELKAAKEFDAATAARLAGERIRLRAKGRDAYVVEMIRWVQTDYPPPGAKEQEMMDNARRVIEGARALGVIQAREAIPVIVEKRRKWTDGYFGFFLVRALVRFGDPSTLKDIEKDAGALLPRQGPTAAPLEPDEPDILWAYWTMRTQGMTQEQTIQELIHAMANEPIGLRPSDMLRLIGRPAVPALVAVLISPPECPHPEQVICGAASTLTYLRAVEAVSPLLDLLRHSDNPLIRRMAAQDLGYIGDRSAVPDLLKAAEDPDFHLNMSAIDALAALGNQRAESLLLRKVLEDGDANIRCAAVEALATCGTAAIVPALQARLTVEPKEGVRGSLRTTIKKLSGQ